MFWYIILIIAIVAFCGSLVALFVIDHYDFDGGWFLTKETLFATIIIALTIVLTLALALPAKTYCDERDVNTFVMQKEYIESKKDGGELGEVSLAQIKVELNKWLCDAQYSYKNYHIFTLLPDKVMDLTPIK